MQPNVTGSINTDELGTIRLLALAGLGIALAPELAAQADVEQGKLARVLPRPTPSRARPSTSSLPPLRLVPSRVTLLRDHLLRELPARLDLVPSESVIHRGRVIPSLRMRAWRVVRLRPSSRAAPAIPPTTHLRCARCSMGPAEALTAAAQLSP